VPQALEQNDTLIGAAGFGGEVTSWVAGAYSMPSTAQSELSVPALPFFIRRCWSLLLFLL
jgi:hypothetical protein